MIAAGIFAFAGIYAGLMPVPKYASWVTGWLVVVCWIVAVLCGTGLVR